MALNMSWRAGRIDDDAGVVYVTLLHLRRVRDMPAFFRDSMAIRRQAIGSPGSRSLVLHARPLRRTFVTISWWDDEAAVRAFVRAQPHRGAMRRWGPEMLGFQNLTFAGTPGVVPGPAEAERVLSAAPWGLCGHPVPKGRLAEAERLSARPSPR